MLSACPSSFPWSELLLVHNAACNATVQQLDWTNLQRTEIQQIAASTCCVIVNGVLSAFTVIAAWLLVGLQDCAQQLAQMLCPCRYFAYMARLAATANSLLLHKGLRNRMWDDSCHVTRQIPGIGSLLAERLAAAGIHHLRKLQEADPRRIETVTQRHYPFGEHFAALSAYAVLMLCCFHGA